MSEMGNDKPLVVTMAKAEILLDCGYDKIYELIKAGLLDSYLEGHRRMVTVASIERHIQKRLAAASGEFRRGRHPRRIQSRRREGTAPEPDAA
jgi:hypothetical protein